MDAIFKFQIGPSWFFSLKSIRTEFYKDQLKFLKDNNYFVKVVVLWKTKRLKKIILDFLSILTHSTIFRSLALYLWAVYMTLIFTKFLKLDKLLLLCN